MKNLTVVFFQTFLKNLLTHYSEAPSAFEKLLTLKNGFQALALELFPELSTQEALQKLSNHSNDLNLCFEFFKIFDEAVFAGIIGRKKTFSFLNQAAINIFDIFSELVAEMGVFDLPEIVSPLDRLSRNFHLRLFKFRLDCELFESEKALQKRQQKTIRLWIFFLSFVTIGNLTFFVFNLFFHKL